MKNIIGGKHEISETIWVVSLVRKKLGDSSNHAFLIIEGIEKGKDKLIRVDFTHASPLKGVLKGAGSLHSSEDFLTCTASSVIGKAEIKQRALLVSELKSLAEKLVCKSYGITRAQAETLLCNIEDDKNSNIAFNLLGDGSSYQVSYSSRRYYSCISWAIEQLRKIGLTVDSHWHDFALVLTKEKLPDETESSKCCLQ